MLLLDSLTSVERLKEIARYFEASFESVPNAAILKLDNSFGKGYMNTYDLSARLSLSVFNVRLKEEFRFGIKEKVRCPLYFLYCTAGHYYQSSGNFKDAVHIGRGQNVILSTGACKVQSFVIVPNTDFKLVLIEVRELKNVPLNSPMPSLIADVLRDIFATVGKLPLNRYIGQIDKKAEVYAEPIIENDRTDVVGKLLYKACVLNILACQLEDYQAYLAGAVKGPSLANSEIEKLLSMSDSIGNNLSKQYTVKSISDALGISQNKLQLGFKYLFGESVAGFVKNLRLEKAKEAIQDTDCSMSEIAEAVGFSSKSHFSKIFKERFGLSPNQYKSSLHSEQKLFELTYRSKAAFCLGKAVLDKLVRNADNHNRTMEVTGCLIYHENEFFQFLEGPMTEVLYVFAKIENDTRHSDVEVIWKGIREERLFDQWGLILVSDQKEIRELTTNKSAGLNIRDMLSEGSGSSVANLRFWKRISNQLKARGMA